VKTLCCAFAFSILASPALAQFTGPGGISPFGFNAPAAAAAAAAGNRPANAPSANPAAPNCRTVFRGRSGAVTECDPPPLGNPN